MHPCCYFPLHWPQWISFPSPLSPPLSTPIQPDSAKNPFHKKSHTHTRLTALFPGLPGWAGTRKAKSNLDFTEARDSEWQWHQPGHMQVCTSLHTDNHASTPPLIFTGQIRLLPPNQQRQSTEARKSHSNKIYFHPHLYCNHLTEYSTLVMALLAGIMCLLIMSPLNIKFDHCIWFYTYSTQRASI